MLAQLFGFSKKHGNVVRGLCGMRLSNRSYRTVES